MRSSMLFLLALSTSAAFTGQGTAAEKLLWHDVRLDSGGRLLSWVESDSPYDEVVRLAWGTFKEVPVQPNGYRTYFTYPVFYGPNDPDHPLFSGRAWTHNPASHTARYASVLALWYERTGDLEARERAFRSFNWASYACRKDGLVKTSLDEGTGYWFSDGYGDYMRHFLRGMASVPRWAPRREDHLLRSASVVRSIRYEDGAIEYRTFDEASTELFRLRARPKEVLLDGAALPLREDLSESEEGYEVRALEDSGFAVRIGHRRGGRISVSTGR